MHKKPGNFTESNQPRRRGRGGRTAEQAATHMIWQAQHIGWPALAQSWQKTLDKLQGR